MSARLLRSCQVIPAGEYRTISISFTPTVLGPGVMHKVEYTGYALAFMSLDKEVSLPTWAGAGVGDHGHLLSPGSPTTPLSPGTSS